MSAPVSFSGSNFFLSHLIRFASTCWKLSRSPSSLTPAVGYLKALASLLLHKILPPYSMKPDSGVCRDEMLLNDSVVVLVAVVIIHLFKYFIWEIHNSFIMEKIYLSCQKHSIMPDSCHFAHLISKIFHFICHGTRTWCSIFNMLGFCIQH